jgi:hypothetical protein
VSFVVFIETGFLAIIFRVVRSAAYRTMAPQPSPSERRKASTGRSAFAFNQRLISTCEHFLAIRHQSPLSTAPPMPG